MWQNSEEDDAKDNCMTGLLKVLQHYPDSFTVQEKQELLGKVLSSIPLVGDTSENPTVLKFVFDLFQKDQKELVMPYMDKITLTCLKVMTDRNQE
jgi:hypothetical protein